ncbi:phosphomevalonate kinase [Corynebacterium glyciniphilum]|uniref:phosphomevalonate kinase n=1 Tax=Corynebacterium glyciniphilum TaxID=1404244 RepID=UPI0026570672|nr:phosphomevalonate kinase [Corynebacterium glyciniphilum]MDN6705249.1 phosphomevalonate kinase [Corynebacterium glyciniphilum]
MTAPRVAEVRAPGKLYIAGEYAVVETGFPAILVAVDRYVTVRVTPASGTGHITSDQYTQSRLEWHRGERQMIVEPDQAPFDFVLAAARIVEEAAVDLGTPLEVFNLDISSELDDESGRKFGLGSSAAVTVATVRALCDYYRLDLSRMEQLKLALLASISVQTSGSGGDVAASMFGGWIAYTSFDREWARAERAVRPLVELLGMDWPGLSVRRVCPPDRLRLLVGWTGSPASTSRLVGDVQSRKQGEGMDYTRFLAESRRCVTGLIEALDSDGTDDVAGIRAGIRRNRELLRELGEHSGTTIETPTLRRLIEIAEASGGAAKTSGAGGGDCGIVLIDSEAADADIDGLLAAWERAGIRVLNLHDHQPDGNPE